MKRVVVSVLLVLMILAALPLTLACAKGEVAPTPAQPEVKGPIKIGNPDGLTGAAAGTIQEVAEGFNARLRYQNEQGGISGHNMELVQIDTKMDPAMVASAWDRLVTVNKVPYIISCSAVAAGPLFPERAKRDSVPWLSGSTNEKYFIAQPGKEADLWSFGVYATYVDRMKVFIMYIKDEWDRMGKPYPIRIGTFNGDTEDYRVCYRAVKYECEKDPEHLKFTTGVWAKSGGVTDTASQTLELKETQTDVVIAMLWDQVWITFVKDAQRLDYNPVMRLGHVTVLSPSAMKALGQLNEGTNAYKLLSGWDETNIPTIQLLHGLNAKYTPNKPERSELYLLGWTMMDVSVEAMKRALNDVGYNSINGVAVRKALEAAPFKPGTVGDGGQGTYEWSSWSHTGGKYIAITSQKDGKVVQVSKYYKAPDLTAEERAPGYWEKD